MRHEGSGKENQRATFSRWSISINLKIMALMCYLDDDHRERYRNSFVMFGVEQEVKELFKEALSYDKSLLIRAYEETKRKPTCFNRWMNFRNTFGSLK